VNNMIVCDSRENMMWKIWKSEDFQEKDALQWCSEEDA